MNGRLPGVLIITVVLLTGCQTFGTPSTLQSQTMLPSKHQSSTNEYIVRFTQCALPRRCIISTIYDGNIYDTQNPRRVGPFHILSVQRNAHPSYRSWYRVRYAATELYGNFYMDIDNQHQIACGDNNFIRRDMAKWRDGPEILNQQQIAAIIAGQSQPNIQTQPKQIHYPKPTP